VCGTVQFHVVPRRNVYILTNWQQQQQPFNGLWSGTTLVGQYQKKQLLWVFMEQERITDSPDGRHPNWDNGAPTATTTLD